MRTPPLVQWISKRIMRAALDTTLEHTMVLTSNASRPASLVMPTIHPMLGIEPGDAVNHQPEFAAAIGLVRYGSFEWKKRAADKGGGLRNRLSQLLRLGSPAANL